MAMESLYEAIISSLTITSPRQRVEEETPPEFAIIIHGPYIPTLTKVVIRTFLQRNPSDNVVVIIATYPPLAASEQEEAAGDQSHRVVFLFMQTPDKVLYPDFWRTNHWNQNLQRLSSFIGLHYAYNDLNIPAALQIRSDAFLGKPNICEYLLSEIEKMPLMPPPPLEATINLTGRIAVGEYSHRQCENKQLKILTDHGISDFWHFGFTKDLIRFFEIRSDQGTGWDEGRGITVKFFPETNLVEQWMRDVRPPIPESMELAELLARYFVVASSLEIEFVWLKTWHQDYGRYFTEGKAYLIPNHQHECTKLVLTSRERWLEFVGDIASRDHPITLSSPPPSPRIYITHPLVIRVASFASEGMPYDQGLPIGRKVLEEYGRMCIAGGASKFTGYTAHLLANDPEDAWCVKAFGSEHNMPVNPSYHLVGLGAWRAVILRKTMDEAQDGDAVVVHCSNFIKYPKFRFFAGSMRRYVEEMMGLMDVYAPMHCNNALMTGASVFEELISDPDQRDKIAQAPMGQCRLIVMRATPKNRDFCRLFERTIKENPILLSPFGKNSYKRMPFWRETAEQSVFNVLAYREGLFPVDWEASWIKPMKDSASDEDSGAERFLRHFSVF